MSAITSAFALEVFDRRRSRSDRLAEFLAVYVNHFGPEHRTPTNELVDFLSSPVASQSIIYFGLTYDTKPCGFATFMHYPEGPIGIVDHIVIAPNLRGYGGFFTFCDLIARYLEQQRIPLDHIISEITLDHRSLASSLKPAILVRMMRLIGFKVAKAPYWTPDPSILEDADSCRAVLLFASQPEREDLPAGEFIRLVQLIYRTHYGRWYERTMTQERYARYRKVADRLLKEIESSVAAFTITSGNFDAIVDIDVCHAPDPPG